MALHSDVIVLGSGPAGVLTAVLLARRGYAVVLLTRQRSRPRIEGVSRRVLDVLRAHGLAEAAAAVGPEVARTAIWNGARAARNREHVTARPAFDAALLRDAARDGVRAIPTRRVGILARADGAAVKFVGADGSEETITARFLVEARGRSAPSPRAGRIRGPETTALTRRIAGAPAAPCTAVESFADGWAWFVSDGTDSFLQIFVDSTEGLPKRGALAAHFDRLAAALPLAQEMIGAGRPAGAVTTRNATPCLAPKVITDRSIRVGDAAAAVDPLSGHGLFEAAGSALAAAAAIHTILAKPANAALARRFFAERTDASFERYCRLGRDFYALETRWPERVFWRARAAWPDRQPAHGPAAFGAVTIDRRPVVA
ncbi:MAG: FAD-dependent monooxygenase, partial [Alphaproteobacteria bacterium]|nr:FAD-dependent monooxygenase [Alphaproteobacteria bacterium]